MPILGFGVYQIPPTRPSRPSPTPSPPATATSTCTLIHQPFGDYYSSWRAMQDLYKQGLIKAIGVSNLYPDRLVDLVDHNEVTPAVNQIETHPFFQRQDYQQLMRERGVQLESWGPFAEGRTNLLSDPNLSQIGNVRRD